MKTTVTRRGTFLGWACVRVSWRWNAHVMLWGFLVRYRVPAVPWAVSTVRWAAFKASHGPANDVSAWWSR